jgi:hypothetical protein
MTDLIFEPLRFIENLKYMGVGMIGVFLIIGVIIGATYAINYFCNKASK